MAEEELRQAGADRIAATVQSGAACFKKAEMNKGGESQLEK
ncbi:MAG: hypothetical protein ACLTXL_12225 [Clostridia bacterium]